MHLNCSELAACARQRVIEKFGNFELIAAIVKCAHGVLATKGGLSPVLMQIGINIIARGMDELTKSFQRVGCVPGPGCARALAVLGSLRRVSGPLFDEKSEIR